MASLRPLEWLSTLLVRFALGAALWSLLTGGASSSWVVGVPAIGGAVAASFALSPVGGVAAHPVAIGRFLSFFFRMSLLGAVDVAARVLRPRMRLRPAVIEYRSDLGAGPARAVFIGTVNLLPGTLVTDVRADTLRVHVLDREMAVTEELRRLETLLAAFLPVEGRV
jgi:multicomponent Na+:H+ antiporter subunit E